MTLAKASRAALIVGVCLVGIVGSAHAQLAVVTQKFAAFSSLSKALLALYDASLSKPPTPATEAKIAALVTRRNAAALSLGDAIEQTMKAETPGDEKGGEQLESIINQIQDLNMKVAYAELLYDPHQDQAEEQAQAPAAAKAAN